LAITTESVLELLDEISQLMTLNGDNPFKVRAFKKAAELLRGATDLEARARAGTLTELTGVGKGIADVLTEFFSLGRSTVRDELLAALPSGLMEFTSLPGVGPKKARQLIDELEIHTLGELEYACRENRLIHLKGFGEKVQAKIMEGLAAKRATEGLRRLDEAFPIAEALLRELSAAINDGHHPAAGALRVEETGDLRRRLEILSSIDFLVELPAGEKAARSVEERARLAVQNFTARVHPPLAIRLNYVEAKRFGYEQAKLTAPHPHWKAIGNPDPQDARDEREFYTAMGLPWIPPEMRETGEEVALARTGQLEKILPWDGVRGVFHNHTTRSDGAASLEEMVIAAKTLGFSYFGISDHSQSAFYAQGLKLPILLEQEKEVRDVQERHPEIRIFWGIESDILADGSLDYDTKTLSKFDFVVASVHSRFQMDRRQMTDRILKAIRNPATRFLGHATGRLLLGRKGYDLDMEAVIREAAKHDVAIEINASPARLDIDWRWGSELRKCGTLVSINPDAHEVAGLADTRYGVAVARKALMPTALVVNSRPTEEVASWLARAR